ncbi:MAG: thiamine phosphate synthase [Burkholderiales bacterium]
MLRGLYAVTPEEPDTVRLLRAVAAAVEGGAQLVQFRSKTGSREVRIAQGSALLSLCRRHRVPLIVNDSVEIAALIDADGVHLGRDDEKVAEARRVLGRRKIIGASSYDRLELALEAQAAGADYVAFGSFFPSCVKPDAPRPSPDLLRRARRSLVVPIVAIGGITVANAAQLIDAGAHAIAVISGLFSAPEIRVAARGFQALFETEEPSP